MGLDAAHAIGSLAKLALRAKRRADKAARSDAEADGAASYGSFCAWLDWVLSSEGVDQAAAFCFNLYEDGGGRWSLELVGTRRFSAAGSDWACEELFATRRHPFAIAHDGPWQEVLALARDLIARYLEAGAHRDVLKAKAAVALGFVDGDLDILYQREQPGGDRAKAAAADVNGERFTRIRKEPRQVTLYQLWPDHAYRAFETQEEGGWQALRFDGEPVADWRPVELVPSTHHTEEGKPVGDAFPVWPGAVIVGERCYRLISPYLGDSAQVLPAAWGSETAYVLNVTRVIDCLDEERSKLKRFPSTGRVMRIEEYAFDKALVEDEVIFKIPEEAPAHPYVTDKLKAVIERNGIRGFKFVPVWKG